MPHRDEPEDNPQVLTAPPPRRVRRIRRPAEGAIRAHAERPEDFRPAGETDIGEAQRQRQPRTLDEIFEGIVADEQAEREASGLGPLTDADRRRFRGFARLTLGKERREFAQQQAGARRDEINRLREEAGQPPRLTPEQVRDRQLGLPDRAPAPPPGLPAFQKVSKADQVSEADTGPLPIVRNLDSIVPGQFQEGDIIEHPTPQGGEFLRVDARAGELTPLVWDNRTKNFEVDPSVPSRLTDETKLEYLDQQITSFSSLSSDPRFGPDTQEAIQRELGLIKAIRQFDGLSEADRFKLAAPRIQSLEKLIGGQLRTLKKAPFDDRIRDGIHILPSGDIVLDKGAGLAISKVTKEKEPPPVPTTVQEFGEQDFQAALKLRRDIISDVLSEHLEEEKIRIAAGDDLGAKVRPLSTEELRRRVQEKLNFLFPQATPAQPAAARVPADEGLPRITTDEERKELAPGTTYIWVDGTTRVRQPDPVDATGRSVEESIKVGLPGAAVGVAGLIKRFLPGRKSRAP